MLCSDRKLSPRWAVFLLIVLNTACDKTSPLGQQEQSIPAQMPQRAILWPSLANSPWPMYRHDPQHTGRSQYLGPQLGEIEWGTNPTRKYELTTGVAIAADGTLYFASGAFLVALNPDSTMKWRFQFSETTYGWPAETTPLLGADGTIYQASNDMYLYTINPDGSLRQKSYVGVSSIDDLTIGLDGTFYSIGYDRYLYAISTGGNSLWKLSVDTGFGYWTYPTFSPDGTTLYVAGADSGLYAVFTTGLVRWQNSLGGRQIWRGLLVDSQGNIYVQPYDRGRLDAVIYSLNPDGTQRWQYRYGGDPATIKVGPTMDANGNLYYADPYTRRIFSLNYAGNLRWEVVYPGGTPSIEPALICDSDGTVYSVVSNTSYNVIAFNADGKVKWTAALPYPSSTDTPPSLGANGRLYFAGDYEMLIYSIR